jgi:hypothetical protein
MTLTATQTLGDCISEASSSATSAPKTVPGAPTVSVQNNCGSSVFTISGLAAGATFTWSDGNTTDNPRTVSSAMTLTATQTLGDCISEASSSATSAPKTVPGAPTVTAGPFCINDNKKISDLPTGDGYKYYTAQTGGSALGGATVLPLGTTTYWVSSTSSAGCEGPRASVSITVNPNSICPAYTGLYFTNTSSTTTGGSATFNLTYTITGAGCNGATGLTAANFVVSAISDNSTNVTYGNTKTYNSSTGILTIPVTVALGNSVYSAGVTFTLALVNAPNHTISTSCDDPVLVTVSTKASGFVTGGGFIIPTNSTGTIGDGAVGSRTNFGFNIKYNKVSTKLQGNWNMIIRTSTGLWQIKSSQPTYLTITQVSPTSSKSDMVFSAANIKNLTTGIGYGTGTVNVTVYDNGEPGSNVDQIFIKITDGATNYYTSSSSANLSTPSSIQKLNAGNIQIHALGGKASSAPTVSSTMEAPSLQSLIISASPNPFTDRIRFTIRAPKAGRATLEVYNMLGQKVGVAFEGQLNDNETRTVEFNAPANHRSSLIYTLRMNGEQISGKLMSIKQ